MKTLTQPEHEKAVLTAHARYALALSAVDECYEQLRKLTSELQSAEGELQSAEGELRALARRRP